jgi:hypothetical protein
MRIISQLLKRKYYTLFVSFFIFLSLIAVPYTHSGNSVSNETTQEIKTRKAINFGTIFDEFVSKCVNSSINMKGVEEAYKKYMRDLKKYIKEGVLYEKKCFKTIKKDFYRYISKEEQKEIKRVTKNYIQAVKTENKVFMSVSSAMYKLAKANRSKSSNAKYEIKKAEKNFDIEGIKISAMKTKLSVAINEYHKVYDEIIIKKIKEKKFNKNNINK